MKWVNEFHARMDRWGERLSKKELRIPVDLTVGVLFSCLPWPSCMSCRSRWPSRKRTPSTAGLSPPC